MEKLEQSEKTGIREIIKKLVRSGRYSDLSGEDLSALCHFAGIEKPQGEEEKKTVLSWIWDSMQEYGTYVSKIYMVFDLDNIDRMFDSSGHSLRGVPSAATLSKLITRRDIVDIIDTNLKFRDDAGFVKNDELLGSILFAGMAGIKEFEGQLVSICTEKQGPDEMTSSYLMDKMVATAFISLVMMESEKAEAVIPDLITTNEEYTTQALMFYYNLNPGKIGRKEAKDFHDFLTKSDNALDFPELTLKVFEKNLKLINSLIAANRFENKAQYIWDVICPAIFRFNNKQLFKEILEGGDQDRIYHVLNYAILKRAEWIVPIVLEELGKDVENADGIIELTMKPFYIIAAAGLSSGDCEWLRTWLSHEGQQAAAIMACIGKDQFREDLVALAEHPHPATNAAANFVLAASDQASVTLLEGLAVELKLSNLRMDSLVMLYCLMKSFGLKPPAELEDLWNISGRPEFNEAVAFYKRFPYRLIKWLDVHATGRPRKFNYVSDDETLEKCLEYLKQVVDSNFAGLLKTMIYRMEDEAARMMIFAMLTDLEKDEPTVETLALSKIIFSDEDAPLEFEEWEFPYALTFFHSSEFKRKEIIKGLKGRSEAHELLLRQTLAYGEGDHPDIAFQTLDGRKNLNDPMLKVVADLKNSGIQEVPDKISFARIISANSPKMIDAILERYYLKNPEGESTESGKKIITDDDIMMLLWLLGSENDLVAGQALGYLASNHESVEWLKRSVRRWFTLGRDDNQCVSRMSDSAFMAATVIKSEEFLSEFMKLLEGSTENYSSRVEKRKVLDIISEILDANSDSRYLLLRGDDSEKVKKSLRLNVKRVFALDRDEKMESLKLISTAYMKMADRKYVAGKAGMTVSISHEDGHMDQSLMQKCLTRSEFGKIAVYLSVTYTDESSGLIFAEVTDPKEHEPSGEIFNAILQSGDYALFTVSWC